MAGKGLGCARNEAARTADHRISHSGSPIRVLVPYPLCSSNKCNLVAPLVRRERRPIIRAGASLNAQTEQLILEEELVHNFKAALNVMSILDGVCPTDCRRSHFPMHSRPASGYRDGRVFVAAARTLVKQKTRVRASVGRSSNESCG